jgi:LPS-assembly lipoprotein
MSRMNRPRQALGRLLAGFAALAASGLAGCGFTPLYAVPGVTGGLSSIAVNVQHGRTAFLLAQDLEDDLARDRSAAPLYRLDLKVQEHQYPRGLQVTGVATRYETHVTVTFQLIELSSGKTMSSGVEPIEVSYAASDQPYAGVAAQQDAESRAAATASDHIRTRLAVYFAERDKH